MKYISTLPLILASSFAHGQVPSRQDLIDSTLEEYGKVTGSMYLNQRRKFLADDKVSALKTNVANIKLALVADIGNIVLLGTIQESAKDVANSGRYKSCGTDAKEIVDKTSAHAERWSRYIRQIQSGQKS